MVDNVEQGRWLSYNDLAWTELIVGPPEDCRDEVEGYCRAIRENAAIPVRTLLHLACGAGILDHTFKRHFRVTGVDLSPGMLDAAINLNPEVTYLPGDMRSVQLAETFDAVAIPDAIGYMTTAEDLQKALSVANRHLKPGGVLLVVAHTREEFRNNNFVYTGTGNDVEITVFENNFIVDALRSLYEATIVYLIRKKGDLEIFCDRHTLGLFSTETWRLLLREELGLQVRELRLDHLYDDNLTEDGSYPLTMFVCTKK